MKKVLYLGLLTLLIAGCSTETNKPHPLYEVKDGCFKLNAFTNNSDSEAYDSAYFYRNDLKVCCGDAGAIYVSKEQDPVYGGYYYLYESANDNMYPQNYGDHLATIPILRSKDLVDWEICGVVDNGFGVYIDKSHNDMLLDDWVSSCTWAPEVIYNDKFENGKGKYFMYFNAATEENPDYNAAVDKTDPSVYDRFQFEGKTSNGYDRFYLCVAVSDTPVGPFRVVTSENYYGDASTPNLNGDIITNYNPCINIKHHFYSRGDRELFGVIDASPYFDGDDLYLYFARHVDSGNTLVSTWCMKMKDMITPDYDSLTALCYPNYIRVEKNSNWASKPWATSSYNFYITEGLYDNNGKYTEADYDKNSQIKTAAYKPGGFEDVEKNTTKTNKYGYKWEGGGCEGPYAYRINNDRFIVIYSSRGYADKFYDSSQAYGTGPLDPFTKPPLRPSAVIGASDINDFATGTGHSTWVRSPDNKETYVIYWVQGNPLDQSSTAWRSELNQGTGRWYAVDRVFEVDTEYGKLLYGNGPTKSLQPRMSYDSGFKNIVSEANIEVSNLVSGKDYLSDGLFVSHEYYKEWETTTNGRTTITVNFDQPKEIGAVMLYNSYDYDYAFARVEGISLNLSEKPSWYTSGKYYPKAEIGTIEFNDIFTNTLGMRTGGSCLASFPSMKVNSLSLTVSGKLSDKNNQIKMSDLVILGK